MSSIHILNSNINVLNTIHKNSLRTDLQSAKHPAHITTPLLPHQLLSLERMKSIESSKDEGTLIGNERLFSSFGILGDKSGTGKTLTMLGHISQMSSVHQKKESTKLHTSSTPSFFSLHESQPEILFDTLIVVPYILLSHWQKSMNNTTLSYHTLKYQRDVDNEACISKMLSSHITLISNTLLQSLNALLISKYASYIWTRIIYDDADKIRIPSACPFLHTKMTWLITSSYKNITNVNQQIHSHVVKQIPPYMVDSLTPYMQDFLKTYIQCHPRLTIFKTVSEVYFQSIIKTVHPFRGYFVVITEDAVLKDSTCIPSINNVRYICKSVKPAPDHTFELLKAGYIEEAVASVNPNSITLTELYDTMACPFTRSRLQENTTCSICYETATTAVPCISPCCMNLFCGRCIISWLLINNKCPLCRKVLESVDLLKIKTQIPIEPPKQKDKLETLVDILQSLTNEQYVIFSRNIEQIYTYIVNKIPRLHNSVDIIQGNTSTILNLVNDFNECKIQILCLSKDSIGLDLHSASHIILMDSLSGEEEEYILGRVQRLGRRQPLTVIELLCRDE